ncbi:MAG: hypothetical protein JKX83_04225 [Pseudomonadales bacterium]|nr:hypothetical protein [Pseudomonadales bacterium]
MKLQMHLIILALYLASYPNISSAGIAIIINNNNGLEAITLTDLKRIYMGNVSKFPNGSSIALSDLKKKDPIRAEFYEKVTRKTVKKMRGHWRQKLFAGEGIPPKENRNSARMKAWVSDLTGAIGYIDAEDIDDTVKTILIIN